MNDCFWIDWSTFRDPNEIVPFVCSELEINYPSPVKNVSGSPPTCILIDYLHIPNFTEGLGQLHLNIKSILVLISIKGCYPLSHMLCDNLWLFWSDGFSNDKLWQFRDFWRGRLQIVRVNSSHGFWEGGLNRECEKGQKKSQCDKSSHHYSLNI